MTYALRVRCYRSLLQDHMLKEPEADTDPDLDEHAAGAETVPDLQAAVAALTELLGGLHGPAAVDIDTRPLQAHLAVVYPADQVGALGYGATLYNTPYAVRSASGAERWVARLIIARRPS